MWYFILKVLLYFDEGITALSDVFRRDAPLVTLGMLRNAAAV